MKKTLAFAFIFVGILISAFAQENSLLWEVSKKNKKTSYLYGTVHIQDKRVFAFDEMVYEKLKTCDALAVELILDEIDVEAMQEHMFLKEGLLKDYMSESEYAMLDSVVKVKTGQSVAMFAKMKPFFLSSQLIQPGKFMPFPLCRFESSKSAVIFLYYKGLDGLKMCKDNGEHYPKFELIEKWAAVI